MMASLLHQDVQHDPVLIHCTPEIMQNASDPNEHLIPVPRVPRPRSAAAQPFGKPGAELLAPVADALVGDHHAALDHSGVIWPASPVSPASTSQS